MSDHPCFDTIRERWEAPFEKPISFNRKTGELTTDTWVIKVFNWTKSGNVSKRDSGYLQISYCPMCGKDLSNVEVKEKNDG